MLDNILGGGYFGLVKEGMFMQSSDLNNQSTRVAVKTLKGKCKRADVYHPGRTGNIFN